MADGFFPARESEPEIRHLLVRMVGTGASAPTKVYGQGVTIARTSEGLYTLTLTGIPGYFMGYTYGLQASTPANVSGHTIVADDYASKVFTFTLYDSAFAVEDLEASEWINFDLWFSTTDTSSVGNR